MGRRRRAAATADLRKGVSRVRNRVIARVFHALGSCEQWGTGIGWMFGACCAAGLPEPACAEPDFRFRVPIFTAPQWEAQLSEAEERIPGALSAGWWPAGRWRRRVRAAQFAW